MLFLDLDGTLVNGTDVVAPGTLDVLRRAQEIGCTPVICTGRSRYRAERIAEQVGQRGYGILLNGGVLLHWETGHLLRKITLTLAAAREAVRLIHEMEMAPLCFAAEEDDRWVYTDRRFPALPGYAAANVERLVYHDHLATALSAPPVSIETYGSQERIGALVAAWRQAFGPTVIAYQWESVGLGCFGAHIHAVEADKALAAQEVAEMLGVPREQTLAIGDEVNDLELLRWAGLGVAMGDGHPETQACADYVTGAFAEDGAAQAIERFVLMPHGEEFVSHPA